MGTGALDVPTPIPALVLSLFKHALEHELVCLHPEAERTQGWTPLQVLFVYLDVCGCSVL